MARNPRYTIPRPDSVRQFSRRWFLLKAVAGARWLINPGGREKPAEPPNWLERALWIAVFAAIAFVGSWLLLSIDLAVVGLVTFAVAFLAYLVSRLSRAARLWWLFRVCVLTILVMAARSTISGKVVGAILGLDVSISFGEPPRTEAYFAAIVVTLIVWLAAERASR